MGLSSEVNERERDIIKNAPTGTRSENLVYTSQEDEERHRVIIVDIMASPNGVFTWYKPNTPPSEDVPMTGLEYWFKFKNFISIRAGMRPRYLVICADDRDLTPLRKIPTQDKRRQHSKVTNPLKLDEHTEKYDNDVFCDNGVLHVDHSTRDMNGALEATAIAPSLCRGSSHLRKPLLRYLMKKLYDWMKSELWETFPLFGDSTSIIFDFDGFGFFMIKLDPTCGCGFSLTWHPFMAKFIVYGEADGKIMSWANFFMDQYNIQIETIDTDINGWHTALSDRHEKLKYNTRIHWININQRKGNDRGKLVITELNMSITYFTKAMGFTTKRQLLIWLIINGTDYANKSDITKMFNVNEVAHAIKTPKCASAISSISYDSYHIKDQVKRAEAREKEIQIVFEMLTHLLQALPYDSKLSKKQPKDHIPAKLKYKPNDTQLTEFARMLWWHIGYWEMNRGVAFDILKEREKEREKS